MIIVRALQVGIRFSRMNIDLAALPDDVETLQRMVRICSQCGRPHRPCAGAGRDRAASAHHPRLQRSQFGRRAERLDDDQLALGLEDLDADIARAKQASRHLNDRDRLRSHAPSAELPGASAARGCGDRFRTARLPLLRRRTAPDRRDRQRDARLVPARLRVIRICRPRYGCRACGTIHQAPAPERPIAKGLASPGLLAHVLVSKYCDHLPLYRQSQIFARQGVELDRSTLANWVGGACWWLEPLQARLAEHVFASQTLCRRHADPGARSRPRPHQDRPALGLCPRRPALERTRSAGGGLFLQSRSPGRASRVSSRRFRGVLQVDGYAGFERLTAGGDIVLAACWAHARRKFYDVHEATGSPIAAEALRRIAELYAIETTIRGHTAEERQGVRNAQSRPLVEAMKPWLETELGRIPGRGGLAEAIRYALTRWAALCRFLDDGRIELDNNPVERAIRPVALGRKNHLFAGFDGGGARWATVCSLIATAKLNDVEPFAYLRGVLERMSDGHPMSRLDDLLPWNWTRQAPQPDHVSGMDAYGKWANVRGRKTSGLPH